MEITQWQGAVAALILYTSGQYLITIEAGEWLTMNSKPTANVPEPYEIKVAGHLNANWAARFEGLSMVQLPEGETVLSGLLDQAALHGVLARIRDLGLRLISVNPVETARSK